jgi:hypothetical protein
MRIAAILTLLCLVVSGCSSGSGSAPAAPYVPYDQIARAALKTAKIPEPDSIEIDGHRLIATYQREFSSVTKAQTFAENALMAIRNASFQKGPVTFYRVTLNGPPPGPGMIRRIGSARYSEGGTVEWEFGK